MNDVIGLEVAIAVAALTMMNSKRRKLSPEEAYERQEKADGALYEAQYKQAHSDHEEYKRSPRAFMRRLNQSKGDL